MCRRIEAKFQALMSSVRAISVTNVTKTFRIFVRAVYHTTAETRANNSFSGRDIGNANFCVDQPRVTCRVKYPFLELSKEFMYCHKNVYVYQYCHKNVRYFHTMS